MRITRRIDVLAAAWSDLFGPEEVRHDADFFELGGTSLLARRLVDRVENESDAGVISAELNFANSAFGALALATDSDEVTSRTEPTDA